MANKSFLKSFNFLANQLPTKRKIFLTTSLNYLNRTYKFSDATFDYIRHATLELLTYEIKDKAIDGNVAEVGVYKGEFAKYLNECFPDKNLYLFDTFKGFDNRDIEKERNNSFSKADANKEFANTSIAEVLSKMPNPTQIIVKQGFFPESAIGIEDKFCLVSLDADLYDPLYSGLQFFYPRLTTGGYILIHDYNNETYKGAKKAVRDFCAKNEISYVPIPDTAGTAIITK
jgi:O-methyltransferase